MSSITIPTYPATVHECGASITYYEPKILSIGSVSGPAFEIRQLIEGVDDDGTAWEPHTTVCQIVGIGGRPYFAIKAGGPAGVWGRPTPIRNPERFGDWPADDLAGTRPSSPEHRQARAFVTAFAHAGAVPK